MSSANTTLVGLAKDTDVAFKKVAVMPHFGVFAKVPVALMTIDNI